MADNKELLVFREAYGFMTTYSNPPRGTDQRAAAWWLTAAHTMLDISRQWEHPLMDRLLLAVFEYIELKAKEDT